MRISDWSSDVCSSDLAVRPDRIGKDVEASDLDQERCMADHGDTEPVHARFRRHGRDVDRRGPSVVGRTSSPPQEFAERSIGLRLARRVEEADSIEMIRDRAFIIRSEEHTSELQSLMRISYAVFCLKKNTKTP